VYSTASRLGGLVAPRLPRVPPEVIEIQPLRGWEDWGRFVCPGFNPGLLKFNRFAVGRIGAHRLPPVSPVVIEDQPLRGWEDWCASPATGFTCGY